MSTLLNLAQSQTEVHVQKHVCVEELDVSSKHFNHLGSTHQAVSLKPGEG